VGRALGANRRLARSACGKRRRARPLNSVVRRRTGKVVEIVRHDVTGTEVVYAHRMKSESTLFHIGSGSEQRARTLSGRSSPWCAYVDARGGVIQVEVTILERHHCPARARLREMELVKLYQPSTNSFGRTSIPQAILDGRPKRMTTRCTCGAADCYGAELRRFEART
jgi:hypothetical protein